MKKFLLVEDSPIVIKILSHINKNDAGFVFDIATTFEEAKQKIEETGPKNYLCAVVDLNLPDAPDGEVVDYTIKLKMPTIVLTGNYDEERREKMLEKRIVDYVVKESRFSYEYVLKLVSRLAKNQDITILVADDSKMSRRYIQDQLETHLYKVCTADDGDTALEMLEKDPNIKLLITDYNMPRMNGFDLVKNIRREVSKNDLVIIGLSGESDGKLTAKFIKNGANDFLNKPFSHEEFHCRILHNIEALEYSEKLKHMAFHDYVTDLPNKQKFFLDGTEELEKMRNQDAAISLALISVDQMHNIQDRYGLDAPDATMRHLTELLPKAFSRFQYARINDSDIAVLMSGLDIDHASKLVDGFREFVEDYIVSVDEISFSFTVSAGISTGNSETLIELLKVADRRLYHARENGENQVCSDN